MEFAITKLKSFRLAATSALLLICFVITASLDTGKEQTENFLFSGGAVGALCSVLVIVSYLRSPIEQGPPLSLLFWRAVCDLGLSLRFLASPGVSYLACGSTRCQVSTDSSGGERNSSFKPSFKCSLFGNFAEIICFIL